jgi:YbgC/YbaW family acyl-CoA thioester hydrolase
MLRGRGGVYRFLGFSFTDLRKQGFWLQGVEAFCEYRKPARFGNLLEVELTVEELKEKSLKLGFNISKKENAELLAIGYLVVVTVDRNTGKPHRFRRKLLTN